MGNGIITIDFEEIKHETDLAWLLLLDGSDPFDPVQVWLPRSQCEIDEELGVAYVPEWLAIEKDLV